MRASRDIPFCLFLTLARLFNRAPSTGANGWRLTVAMVENGGEMSQREEAEVSTRCWRSGPVSAQTRLLAVLHARQTNCAVVFVDRSRRAERDGLRCGKPWAKRAWRETGKKGTGSGVLELGRGSALLLLRQWSAETAGRARRSVALWAVCVFRRLLGSSGVGGRSKLEAICSLMMRMRRESAK